MKVEYTIKEVKPKIYAVILPDDYHRPMLFCRVQEYYESPNPKFRGKSFDIWDYIEWYSRNHHDAFTYAFDWGGFNIPLEVAYNCYDTLKDGYTPYDELYATNPLYKEMADEITQMIPTKLYNQFVNNLVDYGYTLEVMDDEVQAYLMTNWEVTSISKGTNKRDVKKFSKLYKQTLSSFLNN